MTSISYILPLDQPLGRHRLIDELMACLRDDEFDTFEFAVAYAKSGPLVRLDQDLATWHAGGKSVRGIFGIDQKGTSFQALRFAVAAFQEVYVTFAMGVTFHPKIYIFSGPTKASVFVGSNNLTVGGLEANFEACVRLDFKLPSGAAEFAKASELFACLLPPDCAASAVLDEPTLEKLIAGDVLLNERSPETWEARKRVFAVGGNIKELLGLGQFQMAPRTPLPKDAMKKLGKGGAATKPGEKAKPAVAGPLVGDVVPPSVVAPTGLAIQIVPHHNGEIFLSYTAVKQNPDFFQYPFQGMTTPKTNKTGYPQRSPAPVVNIRVFGLNGEIRYFASRFRLTTVDYAKKSEIRITIGDIKDIATPGSLMIITESLEVDVDYELVVYTPDSPEFAGWLAVCNQEMGTGGSANPPRRFGWF